MTGVRLGRDAVLYLNTGTFGSPTWVAIPQFSDLTVGAAWDAADANTRESKMKMKAKTQLEAGVEGKMKFDLTDTNVGTIMDALLSDSVVDVMVLNASNSTNGARGFRFEAQVHRANEDQGLGVAIYEDIMFVPYPTANAKQSVKVTSGAPVFTAI
jgi:hypothetical protein